MCSGPGGECVKSPNRDRSLRAAGRHQCSNRRPPGTMLPIGHAGTIDATVLAPRAPRLYALDPHRATTPVSSPRNTAPRAGSAATKKLALYAASCGGAEHDLVAEVVEAAGEPGDEAVMVAALEVGGPKVVIILVVTQHVVGGGEHGGGHRDDGLHRIAAMPEAQELGAQVPLAAPGPPTVVATGPLSSGCAATGWRWMITRLHVTGYCKYDRGDESEKDAGDYSPFARLGMQIAGRRSLYGRGLGHVVGAKRR